MTVRGSFITEFEHMFMLKPTWKVSFLLVIFEIEKKRIGFCEILDGFRDHVFDELISY